MSTVTNMGQKDLLEVVPPFIAQGSSAMIRLLELRERLSGNRVVTSSTTRSQTCSPTGRAASSWSRCVPLGSR
jgi:hypothetical protein